MKKLVLLTLSFALIGTLLCGCRSKAPEETAGPTDSVESTESDMIEKFNDGDGMSRSRRFNDQY